MKQSLINSRLLLTLWVVSVCLIAMLGAFTLGAAMLRHILGGGDKIPKSLETVVISLAEAPSLLKQAFNELRDVVSGRPPGLLTPKDQVVKPNWKHQFPAPNDDGYLLLSGVSTEEKQYAVQLIRIADGNVMAKWVPDWYYINSQIKPHRFAPKGNPKAYRTIHPLLLNDGSLIFNTGSSLMRLPLCSSKPSWVLDYPYHHSIELSRSGNSVWVPSISEKFFVGNNQLKSTLRDDSLAEVNLDGKVLRNLSFSKILSENNLMSHLLGTTGGAINFDPIHINQITPAKTDSLYWKKDDLLISARHLSAIYLYRPSTGKIIWYKQGPWINQHSVHFVSNHSIAIFSNHVYAGKLKDQFIFDDQRNRVYIYDFTNPQDEAVQLEILNKFEPKTITEGRALISHDKSVFIEETNNSRIFKIDSHGNLLWSYINYFDGKYLGALGWSRYVSRNEMKEKLAIDFSKCN